MTFRFLVHAVEDFLHLIEEIIHESRRRLNRGGRRHINTRNL